MAKPIDISKIERIRDAAVRIISKEGMTQCSVAAIAKSAGVSVGYLYRHYAGKGALINDLLEYYFTMLNDRILGLIANENSIEDVVSEVVGYILESAKTETEKTRFLILLLNDFSGMIPPVVGNRIDTLAKELILRAKESPSIEENITAEDLYFAMIGVPFQFLAQRYSSIMPVMSQLDEKHVIDIALKVIRK